MMKKCEMKNGKNGKNKKEKNGREPLTPIRNCGRYGVHVSNKK